MQPDVRGVGINKLLMRQESGGGVRTCVNLLVACGRMEGAAQHQSSAVTIKCFVLVTFASI